MPPPNSEPRDDDAAAVFDFVQDFLDDQAEGRERPLREYLGRWPGHEEAVAAEYLELTSQDAAASAAGGAGGVNGAAGQDPDRVGHYRLLREVGAGGQGSVWLAEDTRIERRVALKLLGGFVSVERRARLRREAEVISRLAHPGLCQVHEAEIDGDTPYLAMQFVEGQSLADNLELERERVEAGREGRARSVIERPPWFPGDRGELARVLHFVERTARALHAAHEAGVVHRDVKPGNVMVTPGGEPVVLDFGLARDEDSDAAGLTRTGEVFGTPAYMSPEQVRGEQDSIDRRTDVYALGALLYECLTLERPFRGKNRVELEAAILSAPAKDAREHNASLPEDVRVVLETALEKDLARRYPSALAFAEDLRRIREFEPIRARPAGPLLRLARFVRRQPGLAAGLFSTFAALSVGLVVSLSLLSRERAALRSAIGRQYAERAKMLVREDPAVALGLAIEAVELAPNWLTRSALFPTLEGCRIERVLHVDGTKRLWDLAYAPRSGLLAAGADQGDVVLFSLETGERVAAFGGHEGAVRRVAFDPSEAHVASACDDGFVRVFTVPDGTLVLEEELPGAPLLWVEFDPRGERLCVQPAGAPAVVLDASSGAELARFATQPSSSGCARFCADGTRVVTASLARRGLPLTRASEAVLWDAGTGERVALLEHGGPVQTLEVQALAGEEGTLVSASSDGRVRFFDARSGVEQRAAVEIGAPAAAASLAPGGRHLAVTTDAGAESAAWLLDLEADTRRLLGGHEGGTVVHAAFDPRGERLATSAWDRSVRTWNLAGEAIDVYRARLRPLASIWSADGERVVTLSQSPRLHVWAATNQPFLYRLRGHEGGVTWARFLPGGERALTASEDGTLRVWSTPRAAREPGAPAPGSLLATLEGHAGAVRGASLSADGRRVASRAVDGEVRVFDLEGGVLRAAWRFEEAPSVVALHPDGTCILVVEGGRAWRAVVGEEPVPMAWGEGQVEHALFSPDGRFLALAGGGDDVAFFDAHGGESLGVFTCALIKPGVLVEGVRALAFSPDGDELAAACGDGQVRILDAARIGLRKTLASSFVPVRLTWSPDGARLLLVGKLGGRSVQVIEVASGAQSSPEDYHRELVTHGTFDPRGELVGSVSQDGTAYLFDVRDGSTRAHFTGHAGRASWIDLGRHGGALRALTASADGTAVVFPVDALPAALARQPRELTAFERLREEEMARPPR